MLEILGILLIKAESEMLRFSARFLIYGIYSVVLRFCRFLYELDGMFGGYVKFVTNYACPHF